MDSPRPGAAFISRAGCSALITPIGHKLQLGQKVGLGWNSDYCMTCPSCMRGDHNLCAKQQGTIVDAACRAYRLGFLTPLYLIFRESLILVEANYCWAS